MRKTALLLFAGIACLTAQLGAQVTWSSASIGASLTLGGDTVNKFYSSSITLDTVPDDFFGMPPTFGHPYGQTGFNDSTGGVYYELTLTNASNNFRLYINNQTSTPISGFNPGIVISLNLPDSDQGQVRSWTTAAGTDRFSEIFATSFAPYAGGTILTLTQIAPVGTLQPGTPNAIDFTRNFSTQAAAVPEPASAALLLGLAGAGFALARRRRQP